MANSRLVTTPQSEVGKRRIGLVVQGGGLRGAYAVGVLRELYHVAPPETFESIVAVSASVFACSYYVAHQVEEMEATWRDRVHGAQLVRFRNIVAGKPVMGLDYLIDLFRGDVLLNTRRISESTVDLRYVATDYESGAPQYIKPTPMNIFDAMRAACAIPGLYPVPVSVDGIAYYDGANSDPLPLEYPIRQGCTRVLAILTRPLGEICRRRVRSIGSVITHAGRNRYEAIRSAYDSALERLFHPTSGIAVDVIAPKTRALSNLTRQRKRIVRAIEMGKRDAEEYVSHGPIWAGQ